mmetsp:Transcript_20487/g.52931  ORF Transcript_20487/g.52931 Transcript_20487/m.52931 type:complete len:102 (-) Transcript_20487:132-437(-)
MLTVSTRKQLKAQMSKSVLFDGCCCTMIYGDIVAPNSFRRRSMSLPVCADAPSCWTLTRSARSEAEHTAGLGSHHSEVHPGGSHDIYDVCIATRAFLRLAL